MLECKDGGKVCTHGAIDSPTEYYCQLAMAEHDSAGMTTDTPDTTSLLSQSSNPFRGPHHNLCVDTVSDGAAPQHNRFSYLWSLPKCPTTIDSSSLMRPLVRILPAVKASGPRCSVLDSANALLWSRSNLRVILHHRGVAAADISLHRRLIHPSD